MNNTIKNNIIKTTQEVDLDQTPLTDLRHLLDEQFGFETDYQWITVARKTIIFDKACNILLKVDGSVHGSQHGSKEAATKVREWYVNKIKELSDSMSSFWANAHKQLDEHRGIHLKKVIEERESRLNNPDKTPLIRKLFREIKENSYYHWSVDIEDGIDDFPKVKLSIPRYDEDDEKIIKKLGVDKNYLSKKVHTDNSFVNDPVTNLEIEFYDLGYTNE